jgi:hypothetical protein
MAMNFPPPGQPPSGQPPGETPSTPRKKPKGLRATIYRATTHIKRATLGKDRAAKTEEIKEIKKKKKKVEANGLTVAPAPAPAPAPIFATIQHPGQPAIMTAPAMPAPVTQDDLNYHAYIQAQQLGNLAPYGVTPAQPPVQQMPAPIPVIVTATQQLFIASQPPQHSPPQPSFALSASQPAKVSSMGADWNTRASECMEELLARLENGDPDEISSGLAMMQDIAKEISWRPPIGRGWFVTPKPLINEVCQSEVAA